MHTGWELAASLPGFFAVAGIVFCGLALWAARTFVRAQRRVPREHTAPPPVSILKPIKSDGNKPDPGLYAALRGHCTQDYPAEVELLLAVRSLEDAAVPVLRQLIAEFPAMRIEIVETPLVLGTNGKMSNLAQALPLARFAHILISDADIAVGPRYLRRVTAPFLENQTKRRKVGLVTAGYRGRAHPDGTHGEAGPTIGSRLEALAIATDFFPGVLTARLTDGGMRFGLGSTLLVTREALAASGGLEALTNVLADDHDLGQRIGRAGYAVVLSPEVVSTAVPAYSFGSFWKHQLRWARTVRDVRPWSYLGLIFTHPVPWALLYLGATGGSLFAVVVLLFAVIARMAVAMGIGYGVLLDAQVLRDLWLLPVRDCLGLALWVWSYAGDTVEWRGERFRVKQGKLLRIVQGQGRA
jgi:ceramide glucosyltransferase